AWLALKIASKVNERAVWETTANRNLLLALVASAALVFLGHLIVDAARAQFAADPLRHSAVLALWSALRLILRQPLRALAVGALGALAGLGLALALMALRLRIEQAGALTLALAWLLAQGAHLAVGWGRATRIFGLAER